MKTEWSRDFFPLLYKTLHKTRNTDNMYTEIYYVRLHHRL